jgi:DNA polymerase
LGGWLVWCENLLNLFRQGQDVYATYAEMVFGYPVNRKTMPVEGFVGKTGVLGLGYRCGVDRFRSMLVQAARDGGFPEDQMTKELAQRCVDTFRREAFPEFSTGWKVLDNILGTAWMGFGPAVQYRCCTIGQGRVSLPNGLSLNYADPQTDKNGEKWYRYGQRWHKIHGGSFLENIDQALARIVLSEAAIRLADNHGLRFALQLHDELVFIVREKNVDTVSGIVHTELVRSPSWALDLPLKAEIKVGRNYGELEEYIPPAKGNYGSVDPPLADQIPGIVAAGGQVLRTPAAQ